MNACATIVTQNHTRLSDEVFVGLHLLHEVVTRAIGLFSIMIKIDTRISPDIPRLLTVDRTKFNAITARMGAEAWDGGMEDVPRLHSLRQRLHYFSYIHIPTPLPFLRLSFGRMIEHFSFGGNCAGTGN